MWVGGKATNNPVCFAPADWWSDPVCATPAPPARCAAWNIPARPISRAPPRFGPATRKVVPIETCGGAMRVQSVRESAQYSASHIGSE